MTQQNKDNHYIPKMYLKNWCIDGTTTVWMYRRLVSHKNVEWWKQQSINGTAYLPDLYSHVQQGETTDEFERWLNHEVETPAKPVFEKVLTGSVLSDKELLALLRFTAVQIVRTPAYYINNYENWLQTLPQVLTRTMEETLDRARTAIKQGRTLPLRPKTMNSQLIPLKLSPIIDIDGTTYMEAETVVGRAMWLSYIKRMATTNVSILQKHQWHIIEAAPGIEWPTSDDPVICLNYRSDKDYNFNGGISQKNAEILFPLSPKHLLYTYVGNKLSVEKYQRNQLFSNFVRRVILEHGFLHIYSKNRQKNMFRDCPRTVNEKEFKRIHEMLLEWHNNNAESEKEFF